MKTDFRKVEIEVNFEGEKKIVDVSKELANYCKQKTTDIGFEDFCRDIYHNGEVEVSSEHKLAIISLVRDKNCPFFAMVKRGIINLLNKEE
jgi:uncharacterized OsmC-like protein